MADYQVLNVPSDFRGPAREHGQIQIYGDAERVTLFHGRIHEEFDWHIFLSMSGDVAADLSGQLIADQVPISIDDVSNLYFELMVVDGWHRRSVTWPPWQASFQRKYDTADVSRAFRLQKGSSRHPAYDIGKDVADEPGTNKDVSRQSRLIADGGRVYLQGLLVLDLGHTPARLEIHPLDSIAFAMSQDGRTLGVGPEDASWPSDVIRWRVAWFTNSRHHRVNREWRLRRERTTTWYLPIPGRQQNEIDFPPSVSLARYLEVRASPISVWDSKEDEWYDARGVAEVSSPTLSVDPRDETLKLRVSATMNPPNKRGGILIRDYVVRNRPQVLHH
jgi:hypothetical protein